jgi:hypothetical protein
MAAFKNIETPERMEKELLLLNNLFVLVRLRHNRSAFAKLSPYQPIIKENYKSFMK